MIKMFLVFLLANLICIQSKSISLNETSELFKQIISSKNVSKELIKREVGGVGFGTEAIKNIAIENLEILQTYTSDKNLECMPGSFFYNGTCIYFSRRKERLSWLHAERFCRKLPLNTSFLTIQNDHQYESLKNEIIKLREKENPNDQLVFYIGFRFFSNEWKWANNQSLRNTNLTLGKYFWDWTGSHGDCGSIALLKNNELVMRSAPCQSTQGRFICQYTLNPCFMNDICGKNGKCVNLYYKSYCDCSVTIFYEGKYCEKLNFAAIQTIVATGITIILIISIFCQTSAFLELWQALFGKEDYSEDELPRYNENEINSGIAWTEPVDSNEKTTVFSSISRKVETFFQKRKKEYQELNTKNASAYILLALGTSWLTIIQVVVIHGYYQIERLNTLKKHAITKQMCNLLEENYLVEELIYLVPALIFFIILWLYHRTRRFNKYIMVKFKRYFKTNHYKMLQIKQKEVRRERIKKQEEEIKQTKCGKCRFWTYKCLKNNFCRVFCCMFCCSCCVPPSSNYRCFLCYCCTLGWKQTDCAKVFTAIKNIFYYLFLCCIWKRLLRMTKEHKKHKKELKKKGTANDDLEDPNEVDAEDFNDEQEFKRTTFPFPSMPFGSSNRAQSASVYVIYTYDVLNIFVYIYTASISTINIPYFGRPTGILFDFLIQIIHVLLIGIKFYPILIVADMDPYGFVYFCASIYMSIIWVLKLFTKGFCSRTEAFVKQTLKKLSTEYGTQIKTKLANRYNVSNTVLGLFSDDPDPTKKYLSAIKNVVPSVFKEFFGKYDKTNDFNSNPIDFSFSEDYPAHDRYYAPDLNELLTTTTPYSTTLSYGLRDRFKNKTITKAKSFMEILSERNATSDMAINILENLPLYLTLSFLLARYLILFLGCLVDFLGDHWICDKKRDKSNKLNEEFFDFDAEKNKLSVAKWDRFNEQIDSFLNGLDYKDENHFTSEIKRQKNHNYYYIDNLLRNINLFESNNERDANDTSVNYSKIKSEPQRDASKSKQIKKQYVSYFINLFHRYIYKNVPYLKYSKQFVNTYTVAFMVIYFFTLFGFRLSNLFGNSIVVTIELIYRFIFRGMIPTFNFDDHNFNLEFRLTCLATSFVVSIQLLCSIRGFQRDLLKLHKGEKLITSYVNKYRDKDYALKTKAERKKMSSTITSDSLHFPGYLIAHLVYGYAILFLVFFCFTIFFKLITYFPKLLQVSSQVFLPLFILVSLKLIIIKYATKIVFLREDGQRITNLAPYYTLTYFNFFFDCFLGFVACFSRIWQTTVVSVLTLPRLDTSIFNRDSELIIRRLDKGHVAYINYVRMEHWYNNPVVNGFCEMLVESMLYSQIYQKKFELKASIQVEEDANNPSNKTLSVSTTSNNLLRTVTIKPSITKEPGVSRSVSFYQNDNLESEDDVPTLTRQESIMIKKSNPNFQYSSFLRLRNLFYLCLLLKNNPGLRKFRHHYLVNLSQKKEKTIVLEIESFSSMVNKKIFKRLVKMKNYVKSPKAVESTGNVSARTDNRLNEKNDSQEPIVVNDNYDQISETRSTSQRSRRYSS